jgi:hypothetical protein
LERHTTSSLTQVRKYDRVTQLQRKGDAATEEVVLVKGFAYLVKVYLDLVVHYYILVRVSGGSFVLVRSLLRDIVLVEESILKKLCCVFSRTRVSQDKSCVYYGCLSFSDPYACSYCFNRLKLKNTIHT